MSFPHQLEMIQPRLMRGLGEVIGPTMIDLLALQRTLRLAIAA
jgi:hypothetical protein